MKTDPRPSGSDRESRSPIVELAVAGTISAAVASERMQPSPLLDLRHLIKVISKVLWC